MLKYKNPPLPFYGKNPNFKEILLQIAMEMKGHDEFIFIDLFGGSLYLSYLFKSFFPNCQFISNDFDDYHVRQQNYFYTNDILKLCTLVVDLNSSNLNKKMSSDDEKIIRETIDRYVHYKDWITLGAKLCFSGAFISTKENFFKNKYYYKKLG